MTVEFRQSHQESGPISREAQREKEIFAQAREIDVFLRKSSLFQGESESLKRIHEMVQNAVANGDQDFLHYLSCALKKEKEFILAHLRSLSQDTGKELSIIQFQFSLQKNYIHKQIKIPEQHENMWASLAPHEILSSL